MGKDNRRIAAPENCMSPNSFREQKKVDSIVNSTKLRSDGRGFDDIKPMSLKVGLIPSVTGSAYLECGNTKILSSVNGPRDVLQKSDSLTKGQLFCEFKYAMFSCKERQSYLPTDEEINISNSIHEALEPVILLHKFPKARLDISIIVLENDGGAISAAITCAGAALSNAGVEIYDLPIGCSLVYHDSHILIDPVAAEETCGMSKEFAQISVGMMPAYNSQVVYLETSGTLKHALISKGLKSLQLSCQKILIYIRESLKQHVRKPEVSNGVQDTTDEESLCKRTAELKLFQPKKFISTFLENHIRPDGRELTEFRSVLINVSSVGTASGSALVRFGDTSVLCGIKVDLTNPSSEEPNKGFFVPNVTMTSICSNRFVPGPPTEQAQVYSQMIMDLWKTSSFIDPKTLCVVEGNLSWCLFADIVCLSYDGNILDACILALMAALKNTQLPEILIDVEKNNIKVTDNLIPLNINCYVFSASYAVLKDGVLADPSAEEENLADGILTVFLKGHDNSICVQSFGSVKSEQLIHCIECANARHLDMKSLLETLN